MSLYNEFVMEHFRSPHNAGIIEDSSGVGEVGSDTCGDVVKIYLKIKQDIVEDAKFETFGCAIAIASSSIVTDLIKGQSVCNALVLNEDDVMEAIGKLPEDKYRCMKLPLKAVKLAVDDYYTKEPEVYNVGCGACGNCHGKTCCNAGTDKKENINKSGCCSNCKGCGKC